MRVAGSMVAGAGSLIALAVCAYALVIADFAGGPDTSAVGDRARLVVIALVIATVSLAVGAGLRDGHRWTTHVFVALGALLALGAAWWAVGELIG